jgi:hypothetical protein
MSLQNIIRQLGSATPDGQLSVLQWLRALSFWSAVILPLFYVPLLIAGLDSVTRSLLFFGLLVLNALTLIVSHSYRPD